jgi:hypothetical protein
LVILYYSKLVKEFTYGKLFYAWEVLLAWSRMSKQIFSYHKCVTDGNGYRKKIVRIFPTESSQVMTLQVKKFLSEQYIRESTTLIHDSFIGLRALHDSLASAPYMIHKASAPYMNIILVLFGKLL